MSSWAIHAITIDGFQVLVKTQDGTKTTIISAPPQVSHLLVEGGAIRKMYREFADLTLGEFLIRMFSDGK